MQKTPSQLGYRMPAEWEKHEATWLAWPHNRDTWADIEKIEEAYAEIVKNIHAGEKVNLLVNGVSEEQAAKKRLVSANIDIKKVFFYRIRTVDAWIRDYGPTFILNKKENKLAMVKWNFNAWGNKHQELTKDDRIPFDINKKIGLPMFKPSIALEGGSIDVNGSGVCMTTEQCLLNKNRNPHLTKNELEDYLKKYLGVSCVIWLKGGIAGDDTDGHIDDIARFVNDNTVLCSFADKGGINYDALAENFNILKECKINSQKLNVIKLPLPELNFNESLLPASYANFYIGNSAVLVPVFGESSDAEALNTIKKIFPDRKVVSINCKELVYGFGAIHCITQQQPAV